MPPTPLLVEEYLGVGVVALIILNMLAVIFVARLAEVAGDAAPFLAPALGVHHALAAAFVSLATLASDMLDFSTDPERIVLFASNHAGEMVAFALLLAVARTSAVDIGLADACLRRTAARLFRGGAHPRSLFGERKER